MKFAETFAVKLALEAGPDTLTTAAALGIAGVPIDGGQLLDDGVAATLGPLRKLGLEPCQAGAFFFNPLHPDPEERQQGAKRLRRLIPLSAEAGCRWIAFGAGSRHPDIFGGHDPDNLTEAALEEAAAVLGPLAELARQHGVFLSLEPHIRSVIATPERAAELCRRVGCEALKITFDITNYYGFFDLLDPGSMIERCERALGGITGLVHLKEVALQPGFHFHAGLVPIGSGRTDWKRVLRAAAQIAPADTWVVIEHCAGAEEAGNAVTIVREASRAANLVIG
ncbi:MAG: sugar phosphate isomerase/epimerase [Verrucomicrobia bacterium]|nr:MAG: sugar phosphate isomerase/epimerase [Verrucomicrobiota bacterium]